MSSQSSQMVESVNTAARVGALFLSVLIFAAMWESDTTGTPPQQHWLTQRAGVGGPVSVDAMPSTTLVSEEQKAAGFDSLVSMLVLTPEFAAASLENRPTPQLALPARIVPGRYRVVDSNGSVSSITVTESTSGSQRDVQPRDIYTSRYGNQTRYFIRVEDVATAVATTEARLIR